VLIGLNNRRTRHPSSIGDANRQNRADASAASLLRQLGKRIDVANMSSGTRMDRAFATLSSARVLAQALKPRAYLSTSTFQRSHDDYRSSAASIDFTWRDPSQRTTPARNGGGNSQSPVCVDNHQPWPLRQNCCSACQRTWETSERKCDRSSSGNLYRLRFSRIRSIAVYGKPQGWPGWRRRSSFNGSEAYFRSRSRWD